MEGPEFTQCRLASSHDFYERNGPESKSCELSGRYGKFHQQFLYKNVSLLEKAVPNSNKNRRKLKSLHNSLKNLNFELDLTFDLLKNFESAVNNPNNSQNSFFSILKEENLSKEQALKGIKAMCDLLRELLEEKGEQNFGALFEDLKNYSKAVRFIIKFLLEDYNDGRKTDCECLGHPETTVLSYCIDILWKCNILSIHSRIKHILLADTQSNEGLVMKLRKVIEDLKFEKEQLTKNLKSTEKDYCSKIIELERSIKRLSKEKEELHNIVKDRDFQLQSIKNIEKNGDKHLSIIENRLHQMDFNLIEATREKDSQMTEINKFMREMNTYFASITQNDNVKKIKLKQKRTKLPTKNIDILSESDDQFINSKTNNFLYGTMKRQASLKSISEFSDSNSNSRSIKPTSTATPQADSESLDIATLIEQKLKSMMNKSGEKSGKDELLNQNSLKFISLIQNQCKDQLQPNSPQASPSKSPANSSTFSREEVISFSDKTCQTTLSIPCSSGGNSQNKTNKSLLLKYITCTKNTKIKNVDIPGGEDMEKILKLIHKYTKNKKRLRNKSESFTAMTESNIYKLLELIFTEKIILDYENSKGHTNVAFSDFVVDHLIMKFGLKTIAVKNLISLRIGLQDIVKSSLREYRAKKKRSGLNSNSKLANKIDDMKFPYASYIINLLKIDQPHEIIISTHYPPDIENLIIRSRIIFEEAHKKYKLSAMNKKIVVPDQPPNLIHGGECNVLELIHIVTQCIGKDEELCEEFIPKLLPNNIPNFDSKEEENAFMLNFAQSKICFSIAKLGKNVQYMFETLDEDGNGILDSGEIINGLRDKFNVYFSFKEATNFIEYMDSDKSGDIDFDEFSAKINYKSYNKNYARYMITKARFITIVLEQWESHKNRIYDRLIQVFEKFDENSDGVLTFDEFEVLINNIGFSPNHQDDGKISPQKIINLFNETLDSMEEEGMANDDMDYMSPEAFCAMAFKYKLGGYGRDFFEAYITQFLDEKKTASIEDKRLARYQSVLKKTLINTIGK
ncbi:unnamed protein product [Moneuplotes crassus]|uniref:EF-hand domain-containing protein n=1 Tax=Euplotes crassus TaxID=5936 RepID=A0AAD2D9D7_EUPCR|nr:unnamed protein product [Moneuplotes crassus]